jgi:NAD(P)-dependent dehydrogenase (short-subunit alcohol dehydrogenase family)
MGRLSGKVALVTGSGKLRGIGSVTAEAMAREGARVMLADLEASTVAATASGLRDLGFEASHVFVDITDEPSVRNMIAVAGQRFGRIDILFNNAALTATSPGFEAIGASDGDIINMDLEVWRRTFDVNVAGTMLCCKHVLPVMIAAGGGSIVNTSSTAGRRFQSVLHAYGATKAAIDALTGSVAAAYGKKGIRCNAIAPGLTLTANVELLISDERKRIDRDYSLTPNLALPEDQAAAVVFLASDEARHITGQVLVVDGGTTIQMPYYPQIRKLEREGMN